MNFFAGKKKRRESCSAARKNSVHYRRTHYEGHCGAARTRGCSGQGQVVIVRLRFLLFCYLAASGFGQRESGAFGARIAGPEFVSSAE